MAVNLDQLTSEERKTYQRLRRDEPGIDNETLAELAREAKDDIDLEDELRRW